MQFDTTKLPKKLWLAPSELIALSAGDASAHHQLANVCQDGLASGALRLRGRRAVAAEVEVEIEDEPFSDPAEQVQEEINLYASGVTWVDREFDERMGRRTETVMRLAHEPESIDPYHFCGDFTLDWEADQLRVASGPQWHDVRFERGAVARVLRGKNATAPDKTREKLVPGRTPFDEKWRRIEPKARSIFDEIGPYDRSLGITQTSLIRKLEPWLEDQEIKVSVGWLKGKLRSIGL